jgi:hypothetical protein
MTDTFQPLLILEAAEQRLHSHNDQTPGEAQVPSKVDLNPPGWTKLSPFEPKMLGHSPCYLLDSRKRPRLLVSCMPSTTRPWAMQALVISFSVFQTRTNRTRTAP